jgi:hypothetical protein
MSENFLELPDEYLREIGRVAVYWNELEHLLLHTLSIALLGEYAKDGRSMAVFVHMAFPQKLDALSSMLRIIDDSLGLIYRNEVQPLLKRSQEKRNEILHQSWIPQKAEILRLDIKARGTLKFTLEPVEFQELLNTSAFIKSAHWKLWGEITVPLAPKSDPQQGQ